MANNPEKSTKSSTYSERMVADTIEATSETKAASEGTEKTQQQTENGTPEASISAAQGQANQAVAIDSPPEPQKPKKKHRVLVIGIVAALVLAIGGSAYYFLEFVPSSSYQQAVKSMKEKDYTNAVATFSSIPKYRDSMSKIYDIYKDIAGQSYFDEATAGINYMTNYCKAQTQSARSTMLSLYSGDETIWYPDTNDANLKSMEKCASNLKAAKSELDKVFTPAVLEACGDKTLSDACSQFNELHSATVNLLSSNNVMSYLADMMQGSTSTVNADITRATSALTSYERTINSMN